MCSDVIVDDSNKKIPFHRQDENDVNTYLRIKFEYMEKSSTESYCRMSIKNQSTLDYSEYMITII